MSTIDYIELRLEETDPYGSRIVIEEIPGILEPYFNNEYFVYTNGKLYRYVDCEWIPDDITNTIQGKEAIKMITQCNLGKYLCEYRCDRRIKRDHKFTVTPVHLPMAKEGDKRADLLILEELTTFQITHPYRYTLFYKRYNKINKKFIIELDGNIIVKHDDLHKKVIFNIVPNLQLILSNENLSLNEKATKITYAILWDCFETRKIVYGYETTKSWVLNNIVYPHRREALKKGGLK